MKRQAILIILLMVFSSVIIVQSMAAGSECYEWRSGGWQIIAGMGTSSDCARYGRTVRGGTVAYSESGALPSGSGSPAPGFLTCPSATTCSFVEPEPGSTTTTTEPEVEPEPESEPTATTPEPATDDSSDAPPEGTTRPLGDGRVEYTDGQWVYINPEGEREEMTTAQQRRVTDAFYDPETREDFELPQTDMDFTDEDSDDSTPSPESEPESSRYSGPTATYRNIPLGTSDADVQELMDACQGISGTGGQCHREGDRIVMGPSRTGRGSGDDSSGGPGTGSGSEFRFYPSTNDPHQHPNVQRDSGHVYGRSGDGKWVYTDEGGRTHEADGDLTRRLEGLYQEQRADNLQDRRARCHQENGGRCMISGDRVVFSREDTPTTMYYGAYRPGSDELRENLETCNENHGGRCWSDDGGNIQYRRTDSEQPHEYWMYDAETGEIEPTTEAVCGGDDPGQLCCVDGQEQCQRAGENFRARVEQSNLQNIWEGKQVMRGWIKVLEAFGVSDEWDREAFADLHDWAETKAGLAVSGNWAESLCQYTPDLDSPTGMIQYPGSGQFGMWIEGSKTVTKKLDESDSERGAKTQKLYKITGSVMPAGLTKNSGKTDDEGNSACDDEIKFRIMLDDTIVDMGEEGDSDDLIDLNCDSNPFAPIGQGAIYVIDSRDFNQVCWKFEGTPLKAAIDERLQDDLLCARIVESGTPADLGCREAKDAWGNSIDCSDLPDPSEADMGGTGDSGENRPTPRAPSTEI